MGRRADPRARSRRSASSSGSGGSGRVTTQPRHQVAAPPGGARHAPALQAQGRAGVGAWRDGQRHRAVRRRRLDLAAQHRVGDRDRQVHHQVVALAPEDRVRPDRRARSARRRRRPRPGAPWPFSRSTWPSDAPFGMVTSSVRPSEKAIRRLAPLIASSRSISSAARTSCPRLLEAAEPAAAAAAARRTSRPGCRRGRRPRTARRRGPPAESRPPWPNGSPPPKPRMVSRPSASISPASNFLRFSSSPSRSKAAETRLKRSSAGLVARVRVGVLLLGELAEGASDLVRARPRGTPSSR